MKKKLKGEALYMSTNSSNSALQDNTLRYKKQFYQLADNENQLKLAIDINDSINTTIKHMHSKYIPKSKKVISYCRRKEDRRQNTVAIDFPDRRKKERRVHERRTGTDRRQNHIDVQRDRRKSDRRRVVYCDYSPDMIESRNDWLAQKTNTKLEHIRNFSINPQKTKGNIENLIGFAQVPIGLAGPLKINGEHAAGDFYIPLATTEGSLVYTYQWGMQAINLSGGATVRIVRENTVHISPYFILGNLAECVKFKEWITNNYNAIKLKAESTSRYAKLLSIEPKIAGTKVIVTLKYSTGDAAGLNMISIAADEACKYIAGKTGLTFYIKSNFSSDKKISGYNMINGYGRSVIAEVTLKSSVLRRVLKISAKECFDIYQCNIKAGLLADIRGVNCHFANGLTALYLACGQDVAHLANSHVGFTFNEMIGDDIHFSVNLPNIVAGTVGGGTYLNTQKECLEILDCYGDGKADKFVEIVAATALAGEIAIGAAILNGSFVEGHKKYGR